MRRSELEHSVVDDFIRGFHATQSFYGGVEDREVQGIRYLAFENGRRLSRFTHEFFVRDLDPQVAISIARGIDPAQNHFISVLSEEGRAQIAAYQGAGYVYTGNEALMVRALNVELPALTDLDVGRVATLEEGHRLYEAQRDAGLEGHPVTAHHLSAPDCLQRWISVGGKPAAFGRIVLLGALAYLADVVTLPQFRRLGLADALIRQLLTDARAAGASRCVLTATEMATRLYASLGFVPVVPLVGFETP